jgi:hypothetical protein
MIADQPKITHNVEILEIHSDSETRSHDKLLVLGTKLGEMLNGSRDALEEESKMDYDDAVVNERIFATLYRI